LLFLLVSIRFFTLKTGSKDKN